MRPLPVSILGFTAMLATAASACTVFIPSEPRNAASIEYDRQFCDWQRALGERIATDPDPDVAWAGAALAVRDNCEATTPPAFVPSPPTTAGGRLMRHRYCQRSGTCDDALAQWRASESDNLYLMTLALDAGESVTDAELARATRYVDGWHDMRRIVATVVARYDAAPPPKPLDYEPGLIVPPNDPRPAELVFPAMSMRWTLQGLAYRDWTDRALRAKLADILLDAKGTPYAAEYGAQMGVAAATDPLERRRYCTLRLRAGESADALRDLTVTMPDSPRARQFADLLQDHNVLDAVDRVSASLPVHRRPAQVDEDDVDECVNDMDEGDEVDETEGTEAEYAIVDAGAVE